MLARIILLSAFIVYILSSCATRSLPLRKAQRIEGQVWVVTGASSGLGRGIALEAAKWKAKVVLVARNEEVLNGLAKGMRKDGVQSMVVPTDISDSNALKALLEKVLSEWGHIDVWVNNAGVTVFGNFWEVPFREHERVLEVNLKGTMMASYMALGQFLKQDKGKLINIVSAESRLPTPYQSAYAASKAGLTNFGIAVRQELRLAEKDRIGIISVDPWALNTPIWDNAANHTGYAPRMGLMDRTQKAINAVMHAATGRRHRDLAVGWKTHTAYAFNRLAPRLSYRIAAQMVFKHQMKESIPAERTEGNLFTPSKHNAVETDVRERMKVERRRKKIIK